jgi:electron transport complex protein RnfD
VNENQLIVNFAPHIRAKYSTQTIMRDVIIALIPALIAAVIHYGPYSLAVVAVSVAASVVSEYLMEKIIKKKNTIGDLSAVVTGIILAYCLPAGVPLWMAAFGGAVAIIIVKQFFGGLGQNFANPACTARIILFVSFAGTMADWTTGYPDAIAGATPLASGTASYMDLFLGNIGGCIGETCKLALLIGFVYLLVKKIITWHTPVFFIGTVFLLSLAVGNDPVYAILSGGVFLGAFFMATDYVTSPSTKLGRVIFGIGCGAITVLIRKYCSYPEGVSFAILLMNILAPHLESFTLSKSFGGAKK